MKSRYQIDRVVAHWGQVPVDLLFSYGPLTRLPFVVTRLGAAGAEGAGEVVVGPNDFLYTLLPSLLGRDARCLDALLPAAQNDHDRILCEGVSIALHDLVGRISGLPLHTLLGGKKREKVPLMPCIFPKNEDDARQKAKRFFGQGYRYLKLKLIGDLDEDVARVRAVRSVAPAGVVLQGDANEGYKTIPAARAAVEQLGEAGLNIFEDPLKGGVEDYAKLRGCSGAKVMVDELARRTADLVAVLRSQAADVVGIHPDQAGSLSRVMQHVHLVQSFGVELVIGGTGYTGIGSAAYQHLTAVVAADGPCGELGGAFDHGMPHGVVKSPLPMANGDVLIPDTAGLGVDIDEQALAEFEQGRKSWPK